MQVFNKSILTVLFSSLVLSTQARAATLTSEERVNLVVDWFTGLFNNSEQVATEPDIPFLTMENCKVSPIGMSNIDSQYVHLEQYIGGASLLRSSGYEFSPTESAVDLKVYTYADREAAIGTCDEANPTIDLSNLASPSCDLILDYEPKRFFGTNSPTGCPSNFPTPGSNVVSTVEITAMGVNALDLFFSPSLPTIGTEIEFRKIAENPIATNEPVGKVFLMVSLMALAKNRFKTKSNS